jgi:cytochrome o ubiquinol oxidase subunit 2
MNAFQIPQLGGQIYTMSGMKTKLHLIADHKGTYNGRSVSFSGEGFEGMMFKAHVVSNADFKQWVSNVKKKDHPLTLNVYKKLMHPSTDYKVQTYSSVRSGLFHTIMMQYMNPKTYKLLNGDSTVKNIEYK